MKTWSFYIYSRLVSKCFSKGCNFRDRRIRRQQLRHVHHHVTWTHGLMHGWVVIRNALRKFWISPKVRISEIKGNWRRIMTRDVAETTKHYGTVWKMLFGQIRVRQYLDDVDETVKATAPVGVERRARKTGSDGVWVWTLFRWRWAALLKWKSWKYGRQSLPLTIY